MVATVLHRDVVAAAPHDDDVLDRRRRRHGLVGRRLQREDVAAPVAAVGRDQHLGLGVVDAVGQGLRREPAEHDAVGGADAGAGQHRHGSLGDHRQVDVDAVARLHAEPLEGVGEPRHLVEQLGVGDRPGVARLALEVDGDLVTAAGGDVAVEAVVGDVELPADEPLGVGQLPLADRVPVLRPVEQLGRLAGPEPLVVGGRLVVHPRARHEGVGLELVRRRERAVLGEQGVDGVVPTRFVGHAWDLSEPSRPSCQSAATRRSRSQLLHLAGVGQEVERRQRPLPCGRTSSPRLGRRRRPGSVNTAPGGTGSTSKT